MPSDREKDRHDARCVCGSLLARITPEGIEVKCRRCKRVIVIPFPTDGSKGGPRPPPSSDKR